MKQADLTPPLGYPGGTCHVVDRIENTVRLPSLREDLSTKVEMGDDLSNPQASKIYSMETERGGGLFQKMELTAHAQYRMDQRSVTVPEVRLTLINFSKDFQKGHSIRNQNVKKSDLIRLQSLYQIWEASVRRGDEINYQDPRTGLVVVFDVKKNVARIVTTYWAGSKKPSPTSCSRQASFRPDVENWGTQTYTRSPQREERGVIIPRRDEPSEDRETKIPSFSYNTDGADQKEVAVPGGTSVPGEQYGHPYRTRPTQRRVFGTFNPDGWMVLDVESLAEGQGGYPSAFNPSNRTQPESDTRPEGDSQINGPHWDQSSKPVHVRVSPEGADGRMKTAVRIADIMEGLSDKVLDRSTKITSKLTRLDQKFAQWTFSVPSQSGNGVYEVKLKAQRKGNTQDLSKLDVQVKCSCPFWRWQGPEYHGMQEGYLLGSPRGTASTPDIRDPEPRHHFVCKHVASVLDKAKSYFIRPWGKGKGKKMASSNDRVMLAMRVADRYLKTSLDGDSESPVD